MTKTQKITLIVGWAFLLGVILWTPWNIKLEGVYRSSNGGKFTYEQYFKRHPYWRQSEISEWTMNNQLPDAFNPNSRSNTRRFDGYTVLEIAKSRVIIESCIILSSTVLVFLLQCPTKAGSTTK